VPCGEEAAGRACRGLEYNYDRYVEVWNNVFMEFNRQADGTLLPLPAPAIDTGMGLERITAVIQGKLSNYDTDAFTPLLAAIGERTGTTHRGTMETKDVSMRVVADHMRAMTFLIADGVVPSNEWRGYVLRKIMRRAMRHGQRLGVTEPFLHTLVDTLVREFGDAYPELKSGRDAVAQVIRSEEERFAAVLTGGLPRLEEALDRAAAGNKVVPGEAAFRLYDTFGLPRDFIEDMVEERKLTLDREGFERAMEGQREKARAKSAFKGGAQEAAAWTASSDTEPQLTAIGEQVFRGYDSTSLNTQIIAVFDVNRQEVQRLESGAQGFVALKETPFYLEAGGQVSDVGAITAPNGDTKVTAVIRIPNWPRLHAVEVTSGTVANRDLVTATVTADVRDATRRNHTATHLLHAALRQVLGAHVKQAGSLVAPDRLRFDFVHFQPVTREELDRIERIVNEQICRNTTVTTEVRSTQEAIAAGAMALFGEKYGDQVRVVSVPGFSLELCGGTHVRATGDIGFFAIMAEAGVAAGVRRIEAVTGAGAVAWAQHQRAALTGIVDALQVREDLAVEAIGKLQSENKRLAREATQLKTKLAMGGGQASEGDGIVEVNGVKLARRKVADLDRDALRGLADSLKAKVKSGVVVIASASDGRVQIVVAVTADLTARIKAGQIVKEIAPIVGGGGGGRPDFAEAGGKQPENIDQMLAASEGVLAKILKV
jgi:alanyl-tRNA synthetase